MEDSINDLGAILAAKDCAERDFYDGWTDDVYWANDDEWYEEDEWDNDEW